MSLSQIANHVRLWAVLALNLLDRLAYYLDELAVSLDI
jgi:hypothetical protein